MFPIIPIIERIYDHYEPYIEREIQKVSDALEAGAGVIRNTVSETVAHLPGTLARAGHGAHSLLNLWAENFKRAGIGRPLTFQDSPGSAGIKILFWSLREFIFPTNFLFSPMGTEHLAPYQQTLCYKPGKHTETFHRFPMSFDTRLEPQRLP